MPQNQVLRTTGTQWDFLEPAMNPNQARTDHVYIVAAASTTFVTYPKGQVLCQKDDGTNNWAKIGTAGFTGPKRVLKYPLVMNDARQYQLGPTFHGVGGEVFEGSVDAYYQGFFKTQDCVGIADAPALATIGRLVRGTFATGIFELGAAPVAA